MWPSGMVDSLMNILVSKDTKMFFSIHVDSHYTAGKWGWKGQNLSTLKPKKKQFVISLAANQEGNERRLAVKHRNHTKDLHTDSPFWNLINLCFSHKIFVRFCWVKTAGMTENTEGDSRGHQMKKVMCFGGTWKLHNIFPVPFSSYKLAIYLILTLTLSTTQHLWHVCHGRGIPPLRFLPVFLS